MSSNNPSNKNNSLTTKLTFIGCRALCYQPSAINSSQQMSEAKTVKKETGTKKTYVFGAHPEQHAVNVVMTDGTKFEILTTWGKAGDTLRLDVDPKNHPAWQDKATGFVNANNERMTKFKKKFGDFNF